MSRNNSLGKVLDNRQINKFPLPFKYDSTPYQQNDFNEITKQFINKQENLIESFICKVIILGDVCVGKTSIINRFCSNLFETTYKTTIGVDFQVEHFDIFGIPFNMQIWDTAGQERFKSIAQSYYRGTHVIIVVFDLSSIQSLSNCKNWLDEALEVTKSCDPLIFIIGTKQDLLSQQAYENAEIIGAETARCLNGEFWAVSSKTGQNIDGLFKRIAGLAFDNLIKKSQTVNSDCENIKIGKDLKSITINKRKKFCSFC